LYCEAVGYWLVEAELIYVPGAGTWNDDDDDSAVCGGNEEIRLPLVAESRLELEFVESL
jgi:hypothetical protein